MKTLHIEHRTKADIKILCELMEPNWVTGSVGPILDNVLNTFESAVWRNETDLVNAVASLDSRVNTDFIVRALRLKATYGFTARVENFQSVWQVRVTLPKQALLDQALVLITQYTHVVIGWRPGGFWFEVTYPESGNYFIAGLLSRTLFGPKKLKYPHSVILDSRFEVSLRAALIVAIMGIDGMERYAVLLDMAQEGLIDDLIPGIIPS
jgi:hypothetical protein